jgi:hypothetical protein
MNALKGQKTYILAALAAVTIIVQWGVGDLSGHDALQQLWAAAVAASIRHGVGN